MQAKRYDSFGDEALKDSWPVYVNATDYDAMSSLLDEAICLLRDVGGPVGGIPWVVPNKWKAARDALLSKFHYTGDQE